MDRAEIGPISAPNKYLNMPCTANLKQNSRLSKTVGLSRVVLSLSKKSTMSPSKNKKSTMAKDSMFTPFNLICYIGLAVVVANVADLTLSWFQRPAKAKKSKSAKGKDAEHELDEIHRIIDRKGDAAKHMTVLELAKELRDFGGIWSELHNSRHE